MSAVAIRTVEAPEVTRAESVQLMAFSADPVMRWLWREPHVYVSNFPRFLRAFGGGAFGAGTAHVRADFVAGALWLPPGVTPDGDALEALMAETVAEPALSEAGRIMEQIGAAHPEGPHWHLAFLGVDRAIRGRASVPRCCSTRFRASTSSGSRPTSNRRIRRTCRSTSATASR